MIWIERFKLLQGKKLFGTNNWSQWSKKLKHPLKHLKTPPRQKKTKTNSKICCSRMSSFHLRNSSKKTKKFYDLKENHIELLLNRPSLISKPISISKRKKFKVILQHNHRSRLFYHPLRLLRMVKRRAKRMTKLKSLKLKQDKISSTTTLSSMMLQRQVKSLWTCSIEHPPNI